MRFGLRRAYRLIRAIIPLLLRFMLPVVSGEAARSFAPVRPSSQNQFEQHSAIDVWGVARPLAP